MLSINIPVYQIEVENLISELVFQAEKLSVPFEIRVYDDGSKDEIKKRNRVIEKQNNVIYLELEKNLGRVAIRNKMGLESKYKYLLFIDADSKPVNENYLEFFLGNAKPNRVLCGGTAYSKEKPQESEKFLRWFYGSHREAISAEIRNSKKGFIITSNNFLIEKTVFEKIHFRENLKNYGHEDTLLGYDLFCNKIEIFHINNPVEHTGLEDAGIFLEKTKMALQNLHRITTTLLVNDNNFVEQVNFLNRYRAITKTVPPIFFRAFYAVAKKQIEYHLKSKNPRLFWFDMYKIGFYSTLKNL